MVAHPGPVYCATCDEPRWCSTIRELADRYGVKFGQPLPEVQSGDASSDIIGAWTLPQLSRRAGLRLIHPSLPGTILVSESRRGWTSYDQAMPTIDEIEPRSGMRVLGVTDETEEYRWWLERCWDESLPVMAFIGFNPRSDGRHLANDQTTNRCIQVARDAGCGGVILVNLFARRSDTTADLASSGDPVGAECDVWLRKAVTKAATTVAAWGVPPPWAIPRAEAVLEAFGPLECLGFTAGGHPRHPSRVGRAALQLYEPPIAEARVIEAFGAWLEAEGWAVGYEVGWADVVAERGDERLVAEAKGLTSEPGLDVDTLYGQLLRRMADSPRATRLGVVVPIQLAAAALRVSAEVRRALGIDVYTVDRDGAIEAHYSDHRRAY